MVLSITGNCAKKTQIPFFQGIVMLVDASQPLPRKQKPSVSSAAALRCVSDKSNHGGGSFLLSAPLTWLLYSSGCVALCFRLKVITTTAHFFLRTPAADQVTLFTSNSNWINPTSVPQQAYFLSSLQRRQQLHRWLDLVKDWRGHWASYGLYTILERLEITHENMAQGGSCVC